MDKNTYDQQNKLFLKALKNNPTERIPVWFMRQAGRYLPEYRELREKKGGFLDLVYDPDFASEVTLQPIRRFNMDAAILFSDILVIPQALGQKLEFVAGEGPKLDAIKDEQDFKKLSPVNFQQVLGPIFETIKQTRSKLIAEGYEDVALIGFAGSPWTVACYMIEGQGSKDFMKTKVMAYGRPNLFSRLIDLLVETTSKYLIEQVNAGAEAIQLFDSWSGVLDATQFRRWVIDPTQKIINNVREVHKHVPIIGFPKGAGQNYLSYANDTGITAVGLDSQVPTQWAARALQPNMPVQGNLDPFCLFAGRDQMVLEIEKILAHLADGPFIFNLGHGIHKDTPIENVQQALSMVWDWKNQNNG